MHPKSAFFFVGNCITSASQELVIHQYHSPSPPIYFQQCCCLANQLPLCAFCFSSLGVAPHFCVQWTSLHCRCSLALKSIKILLKFYSYLPKLVSRLWLVHSWSERTDHFFAICKQKHNWTVPHPGQCRLLQCWWQQPNQPPLRLWLFLWIPTKTAPEAAAPVTSPLLCCCLQSWSGSSWFQDADL